MKIIINIPDEELTRLAATVALATGNSLPVCFNEVLGQTPEVDITEVLNSDNETKVAIQGMGFVALNEVIKKCEQFETP